MECLFRIMFEDKNTKSYLESYLNKQLFRLTLLKIAQKINLLLNRMHKLIIQCILIVSSFLFIELYLFINTNITYE